MATITIEQVEIVQKWQVHLNVVRLLIPDIYLNCTG